MSESWQKVFGRETHRVKMSGTHAPGTVAFFLLGVETGVAMSKRKISVKEMV